MTCITYLGNMLYRILVIVFYNKSATKAESLPFCISPHSACGRRHHADHTRHCYYGSAYCCGDNMHND